MAAILDGATQYYSSTAFFTAAPFTVAAYINPDDVTNDHYIVSVYKAALDTSLFRVRAAGLTGGDPIRMSIQEVAASEAVSTSTAFVATTWQKIQWTATSNVLRNIRLENAGLGTGNTDITPTGIDSSLIGATINATVKSGFFKGKLAYVTIWSIVLVAGDLAKHQAGYDPFFIQRASILMHARFDTSAATQAGAFTLTAVATPTYTTSPGLLTPRPWI